MKPNSPATERQIDYVRSLIARRDTSIVVEMVMNLEDRILNEKLTHRDVNQAIPMLKLLPLKTDVRQRDQTTGTKIVTAGTKIPDGYYAIGPVGDTRFYRVSKPTTGKWSGYIFLNIQAGDDLYPVKNHTERLRVLEVIAEDVRAAAIRYGKELGRCSQCNRTLTNPDSIIAGIGPWCAQKAGW
jgi:hypothetical protein